MKIVIEGSVKEIAEFAEQLNDQQTLSIGIKKDKTVTEVVNGNCKDFTAVGNDVVPDLDRMNESVILRMKRRPSSIANINPMLK